MRFIDEAKVKILAGHGGPGCISFRRETFIPRGGPDGGNGGAGGSIIFIASNQMSTLQDFRFKRSYQAKNGLHGSGANKSGKAGEDCSIRIPVGTVIKDLNTGEILHDFVKNGEEWLACKGGRGGKGNAHFTTSTHQAPKFAQPGEEGESKEIALELKLIADVGIIGFPNAGKSTLISKVTAARPKIAEYPFTTLVPNLGVVALPDYSNFVLADIPGLIEGAHRGLGLGHRFLKHLERTRIFIHLIDSSVLLEDLSDEEKIASLLEKYRAIRKELGLFNEKLLNKPEIVVLNKLDLFETTPELLKKFKQALQKEIKTEPFMISAVSGFGLQDLLFEIKNQLQALKQTAQ